MIRFFVSSTFRDMREEREILHGIVLPAVRTYAEEKGEFVDICDLRWGIDLGNEPDESDEYYQLMNICLDAIDDCKGYMICFLGDSYGTQLDEEEAAVFESIWESRRSEPLSSYRISLTQMELEYGLLHGDPSKCLCFRRNCADDPESKPGQQELQSELIHAVRDRCPAENFFEYDAEWDSQAETARLSSDYSETLITAMKSVIDKLVEAQKSQNWVEREQAIARALAEDLHSSFAGREELFNQLDSLLDKHHCAVIYGESGIGKSAFLAQWLWRHRLLHTNTCHYVTCGWGERSKTVLDVAAQLIHLLKVTILELDGEQPDFGIKEFNEESRAIKELEGLISIYDLKLAQHGEQGYIVLDAIDQLVALDGESGFSWLSTLQLTNLNVVLSSINRLDGRLGKASWSLARSDDRDRHLQLKELTEEDVRQIIEHQMYRMGHVATEMILEPIRAKRDHAKPLYLRGVLDILKMKLGSIQSGDNLQVFEHHQHEIEQIGDTIDELVWQVLNEAARYTGHNIVVSARTALDDYQNYLGLIATSSYGLTDKDAEDVLAIDVSTWEADRTDAFEGLVGYCRLFLRSFYRCDEDGRWTFGHNLIILSVEQHTELQRSKELFCQYGDKYVEQLDMTDARRTLIFADVARSSLMLGRHELFGALLNRANSLEDEARARYQRNNDLGRYSTYHGLLIKTVNQYLQEWPQGEYLAIIHAYPDDLQTALAGALAPVASGLDPDRRISAMRPASVFIKERCQNGVPTSLNFHWLLKQLIDIYDDTSRQPEAFDLLKIACDYLSSRGLSGHTDDEQLKLISLANLVFFCSNKLIKLKIDEDERIDSADPDLEEHFASFDEEAQKRCAISDAMLAWYKREIEGHDEIIGNPLLADRCAAYTNNVGQRYNALYRVDKGFPYRMRAQTIKVSEAFKLLKLEDHSPAFLALCDQEVPKSIEDHKALARAHARFWNQLKIVVPEKTSREYRLASKYLESIATTYLALGTDYFYWPKLRPGNDSLWHQIGSSYLSLSAKLMDLPGFPVKQKQLTVVLIRQVGMQAERLNWYSNNYDKIAPLDAHQERSNFEAIVSRTLQLYLNYARFDIQEGEKLRSAIEKGAGALENLTNGGRTKLIQSSLDALPQQLDSAQDGGNA